MQWNHWGVFNVLRRHWHRTYQWFHLFHGAVLKVFNESQPVPHGIRPGCPGTSWWTTCCEWRTPPPKRWQQKKRSTWWHGTWNEENWEYLCEKPAGPFPLLKLQSQTVQLVTSVTHIYLHCTKDIKAHFTFPPQCAAQKLEHENPNPPSKAPP